MSELNVLIETVGDRLMDKAIKFISVDAWNLVSDEGKLQVLQAARLMVECEFAAMAGRDVSIPVAALRAAFGNWKLAGKIRMAQHTDEFLDELKEGLFVAAKIIFSTAIAGLL